MKQRFSNIIVGLFTASALVAGLLLSITPANAATGANCKLRTPSSKAQCDLITVALVNKVLTLDPANPGRTTNQNYVTRLLVQGMLFRYDANGVAQPDLVDKYTTSADGLTWTFMLKKGLKYSDGVTPVTADDAVFSWQYNLNPAPPGFQGITKVAAKDAETIVVTLAKPFSDFPRAVASIYWTINPRSLAEGKPAYWKNPVSAGPFRIKKWVEGSDEFLVEANPNYWAKLAVKEVRFLAIPDPVTRVLALKQGTIDYAFDLPSTIGRNQLKDKRKFRAQPFQLQGNFTLDFNLRNTADKPWADARVRQALSYALDRQQFSDLAFDGDIIPACALTYPTHPNYVCVKPGGVEQDIDKAKSLLAQTKWPTGFNIRLSVFNRPGWADGAAVIASQWGKIGVVTTVAAEADAISLAGQVNGTFEVQLSGYGSTWLSGGLGTYMGAVGAWTVWSGSKANDSLVVDYDAAQGKANQQIVLNKIEQLIWDESAHLMVGQRSGWGASSLPKGIFQNSTATDLYYVKQTPALGAVIKAKRKRR
ncbi:MAG: ABC transporter substrate-binding protein [Actinomycetota bacterium]|nr:ABC transporter substrate-binding protein [Actinomycetota bacterium]